MKIFIIVMISFMSLSVHSKKPLLSKADLKKMTDEQLWEAATSGKVGRCFISDATQCSSCACDYYVKTTKEGLKGPGLPHGYGTGCVVAPSGPKGMSICWGAPNVYQDYSNSKTPICTTNHVKNATNMIRIALARKENICDL